LDVSVELTDEGVKHATDVLRVVYHYIHHVLL
jgi:secreted Zn-dependent insulinase-like peptidase